MISASTQRIIVRWVHIVLAIPIVGYIYSPFQELPNYAPVVRYIALPVMGRYGAVDVERASPPTTVLKKARATK